MMLGQQPREHRHRILAAVFLIRRDQDDVLARSRTLVAGVRQPQRTLRDRMLGGIQSVSVDWYREENTKQESEQD